MNNEQIVRRAYEMAEKVDVKGFVDCFTPDGTFTDMSIGVTYRGAEGPTGLGKDVGSLHESHADRLSPGSGKRVFCATPVLEVSH